MRINSVKKRGLFILWIIVFIVPFVSSCATDEKFAYTNDQINAANRKIASLEETIDQSIDKKLTNINSNQAALRIEIDQLKQDISTLSGRVEETENLVKHSLEKDLTSQDTLRSDLSDLSSRVAALESSVNQQQSYLGLNEGQVEGADAALGTGESAEAQDTGEQYLYDSSLALYNDGQFAEAKSGFENFIKQYPKSDLADNAQFWIGECYMSTREYESAILAFEDVIKKYSKGNKVPNAMLRQGIAFSEINDKDSATIILKRLVKQYPDSNEAKVAKKKLETMK